MLSNVYRFEFGDAVAIEEIEGTLLLALAAAEDLHGSQVRLDGEHAFDAVLKVCVINAATAVGRDLNKLFAGFLAREFGAAAFHVERLAGGQPASTAV
ncbi:MAG TPA: hypothetical protein VGL71_02115 [Urbifossiella sp.]